LRVTQAQTPGTWGHLLRGLVQTNHSPPQIRRPPRGHCVLSPGSRSWQSFILLDLLTLILNKHFGAFLEETIYPIFMYILYTNLSPRFGHIDLGSRTKRKIDKLPLPPLGTTNIFTRMLMPWDRRCEKGCLSLSRLCKCLGRPRRVVARHVRRQRQGLLSCLGPVRGRCCQPPGPTARQAQQDI